MTQQASVESTSRGRYVSVISRTVLSASLAIGSLAAVSCTEVTSTLPPGEFTVTASGGEFVFGAVTIRIGSGLVGSPVTIRFAEATGAPPSPNIVGVPVTITLEPAAVIPAEIEVNYSGFTGPELVPNSSLQIFSVVSGDWASLGGDNVDPLASALITGAGTYALIGRRATTVTASSQTVQSGTNGANAGSVPAVIVKADDNQPLAGVVVEFDVTAGGGVVAPSSVVSDANGVASLTSWTFGPADGTNTVAASVSGLEDVNFNANVAAAPPPPAILFQSQWNTGTGSALNVLSDGGLWATPSPFSSEVMTVMPGAPLGWTKTANVLRFQQLGTKWGQVIKSNLVPQSTTFWGRMYFRNDETQTRNFHVFTLNPIGAIQVTLWNRIGTASGITPWFYTYYTSAGTATPYPFYLWYPGVRGVAGRSVLPNATWFRYEWMFEYVTPTTYRLWPKIYDMGDNLLFDANTFFQNDYNGSSGVSLKEYYDAGNTFGFTNVALARNFGFGNEGPAGTTATLGYWYHADVAFSLTGWIGP